MVGRSVSDLSELPRLRMQLETSKTEANDLGRDLQTILQAI